MLLEPVPFSWVGPLVTLLDALRGDVVVVLVDPDALLIVGVDLVAVLPLDEEAHSVDSLQESEGRSRRTSMSALLAQQSLADPRGMAPHNRPEVLLGVPLELVSLEDCPIVIASLPGKVNVDVKVRALANIKHRAALDLAEPSVEQVCVAATLAKVLVENNWSHGHQALHEVLWRFGRIVL